MEIVQSVQNCIEGALKIFEKEGHSKESIKAIGITNQRETTVVWDQKTGEALHNVSKSNLKSGCLSLGACTSIDRSTICRQLSGPTQEQQHWLEN